MPPKKFGLSLQLPPDAAGAPAVGPDAAGPARGDGSGRNTLRDSWEVGTNGAVTVLSKSITPYQFSSEGMIKAANRAAPQHHYRVAERDIFVIKTLGRGASSVVFKGFLIRETRFVALKKINILQKARRGAAGRWGTGEPGIGRFQPDRETRAQMMNDVKALCDTPNVPGLINFYGAYHVPGSGQISLVLEYMDGGCLADVLRVVGAIPEGVLSRITARVLQGLAFLHRRHLVHRDIKPANILLNLQGEAKISDFGISAFVADTVANCNTFTGTVTYMSPERIEGRPYGFPADIWSLGLVLVEAATGRYPYDATGGPILHDEPPLPAPGSVSDALRDFVRACLATDPKRRPSAEQLLAHPFVTGAAGGAAPQQQPTPEVAAELQRFMSVMADPLEKMDEIAFQFAWMYYAALSKGQEGLRRLGGLYSRESLLHHQGEACRGRDAVMARLNAAAAMHAGFGGAAWRIKAVDSQPLGVDGTMLLHVTGSVTLGGGVASSSGGGGGDASSSGRNTQGGGGGGSGGGGFGGGGASNGGGGAAFAASSGGSGGGGGGGEQAHSSSGGYDGGGGGAGPPPPPSPASCPFAETFILKRSPTGEYFVTNQCTRFDL
ncbi:hypothetical protein Rsub_12068 [Raphidocelis subcapitata]|uniref:mitogen-activated protein kinase kinase n=1 Tax=Raphidocelis subcapitata TaxID=307507 RepID=A0A2V0PIH6_9CHLO|nr:hypothetical protein Rsub_12068 [Raphidocelis subcapitata]|eukprot:GBF99604.1 hypothetical protein Rsub_12068 [Raphidocelis subcapitata]